MYGDSVVCVLEDSQIRDQLPGGLAFGEMKKIITDEGGCHTGLVIGGQGRLRMAGGKAYANRE
jgi:hypothetical protein